MPSPREIALAVNGKSGGNQFEAEPPPDTTPVPKEPDYSGGAPNPADGPLPAKVK